jgi:hypothetical protein
MTALRNARPVNGTAAPGGNLYVGPSLAASLRDLVVALALQRG